MNEMSGYDYNKDGVCSGKGLNINVQVNNFTNPSYGASFKSMRYCKAKKDKPIS